MAIRYSGTLKIRVTVNARNDGWIARISEGGHHIGTATVSEPRATRIAIDSPEAFDGAARAAIAFTDGTEGADTDDTGIVVTRRIVFA